MTKMTQLTKAFTNTNMDDASKHIYINLDNIVAIHIDNDYGCTMLDALESEHGYAVAETPEEIMQLAKKGQ